LAIACAPQARWWPCPAPAQTGWQQSRGIGNAQRGVTDHWSTTKARRRPAALLGAGGNLRF
jgi:hypothetical protein